MGSLRLFQNDAGVVDVDFHRWLNDFDFYLATDWVITETGSGTRAIQQENHGILKITNGASDDDANFLQLRQLASGQVAENWKFVSGKRMYFGMRFKLSDATQSDFVFGLQVTDTTPLAVVDGIFFQKDDGDAYLDFHAVKNSTATDVTAIATLANDTYTVIEAYYDGGSYIDLYVDGVASGTCALTNVVDDEELAISFGIQNGEAVAKSLYVDWIKVMAER